MNSAVALLSALLVGAPAPTPRRIAALLVPMDQQAEASVPRMEGFLAAALAEYQGLETKRPEDLFGLPVGNDPAASLKRAETGYQESLATFQARDLAGAEPKLRATVKEFTKAAGALSGCAHLCDAIAMYAATLHARGNTDDAKYALLDLAALAPTFELDKKRFTQDFISYRAQVALSHSAQLRGNIEVRSRPAGARVIVDGEPKGFTPMTVQTLPIGKHLLRLEHPGFAIHGELVEVSTEEAKVNAGLKPTAEYKTYDTMLDGLAASVLKEKGGATLTQLGQKFGLDRALLGTVKGLAESNDTELIVGYFDLSTGKRLASRKVVFQGEEFGQLQSELGRLVNWLLNAVEGGDKVVKAADPLENKSGLEEWNAEDKGGVRTKKEKRKKASDPLEGVSGTEDW